jgi:hypothetical protein
VVRQDTRGLQLGREAVGFTRVTPGGTLLQEAPPRAFPSG